MIYQVNRISLRAIGVDTTPRIPPRATGRGHAIDTLASLVVVSVGPGSPTHAAVNDALKALGAVVMVKASTGEVLEILAAFVPSAVIVELIAGDDAGLALVHAVRNLRPDHGGRVPVIAVSAEPIDPTPVIQAGFQEVLVGPVETAEIARAVLAAISRPR
jgi:CheY-like chemotaxis protein